MILPNETSWKENMGARKHRANSVNLKPVKKYLAQIYDTKLSTTFYGNSNDWFVSVF